VTHAPVFYCPYCGEEDLRPAEGGHGQWLCAGCRRVWSVKFIGLAGAGGVATVPAAPVRGRTP
jgi:transposase-like protein